MMQTNCGLTNCSGKSPETGFSFSIWRLVKSWVTYKISILHFYFYCCLSFSFSSIWCYLIPSFRRVTSQLRRVTSAFFSDVSSGFIMATILSAVVMITLAAVMLWRHIRWCHILRCNIRWRHNILSSFYGDVNIHLIYQNIYCQRCKRICKLLHNFKMLHLQMILFLQISNIEKLWYTNLSSFFKVSELLNKS